MLILVDKYQVSWALGFGFWGSGLGFWIRGFRLEVDGIWSWFVGGWRSDLANASFF